MVPRSAVLGGGDACGRSRCTEWGKRMRVPPVGPWVELPMELRSAALGGEPHASSAAGAFGPS
eukprot:5436066-Pyramimonas_sp.AAC.1